MYAGNFWLAENRVPSKEGLCPVELVKIMGPLCNRSCCDLCK